MLLGFGVAWGQTSGNIGYGQAGGRARAEQEERNDRALSAQDLPAGRNEMYVDASVLMNVKADEYVAMFGLAQQGATVEEAQAKVDGQVRQFSDALKTLGVGAADVYVDYVTEPKIYSYEIKGNVARERLSGFELKKNVSVHYKDRDLLDRLVAGAARAQIYDLVKVDYVVRDINAVEDKLMGVAAGVVKQKLARDRRLLGVRTVGPAVVIAERTAIHYPAELYDSYVAAEGETVRPANLAKVTIEPARKSRTFFFDGLDGNGFDRVVNPVILEPVVQFTLYLKIRYGVGR